mgnify:CR=1 FL=1
MAAKRPNSTLNRRSATPRSPTNGASSWSVLSAIVMILSMAEMVGIPLDFPGRLWLVAALTTPVQFWVGRDFYLGAWNALKNRTTNMDTLVALGSSVAYFYSLVVLVLGLDPMHYHVYFESAAMIITLIIVGKYLEVRAKGPARPFASCWVYVPAPPESCAAAANARKRSKWRLTMCSLATL